MKEDEKFVKEDEKFIETVEVGDEMVSRKEGTFRDLVELEKYVVDNRPPRHRW